MMAQELSFNEPIWQAYEHFQDIKEVLEGLLQKNPENRLSVKKAIQHPLFKLVKMNMRDMNRGLLKENINFTKRIRKKRQNVIKRGMLLFMAIRLLPDERY